MINWQVVATIAAPLIALFIGAWLNRRLENRAILVSHYGHVSGFTARPPGPGQAPIIVNTHSVILRNAGRLAATNVRLRHVVLPDFNIFPGVAHTVQTLPAGEREIVIPVLVPGEEITISYLYFPPVLVNQVNAGIRCDQGIARQIPVLLQRQFPQWVNLLTLSLAFIGLVTVLYLIYVAIAYFLR